MALVMLIEDEPVLRSSMARGLARLPNVEVIDASLFRDAVRLLDAERPDLIVSDLDLPDGSGVEILNVLDSIGLRVPVVFVTAYLGSFRGQLPNRSDVEVYEKPLPLVKLREVVMRHLDVEQAVGGHESPFSLADYLQLACMGRHSVVLDVAQRGEPMGRIVVVRGQVWSAAAGRETGEEAVATLAFGTSGASTQVRRLVGEPGPRDVQRPWQHILLNAARVHDEAVRDQGRPGATPPAARPPLPRQPRPGLPGRAGRSRPSSSGLPSSAGRATGLPSSAGRARSPQAPAAEPAAAGRAQRGSFASGPLPESHPPRPLKPIEPGPAAGSSDLRPSASQERASAAAESPAALLRPDLAADDASGKAEWSSRADRSAERSTDRPATERVSTPPPLRPSEAPAPAPQVDEDFATLMDRGLDAMLGRDYATAWRALHRADKIQPGVPTVLANLARLRQLGFGDDA